MFTIGFEPTIGMRAIVEALENKTLLSTRQAWGFMIPCDPDAFDEAVEMLGNTTEFDAKNPCVYHNSEFWKALGFTADYVIDQIDLNS